MTGAAKSACPETGANSLWVDVRDVADAHIAAAAKPEAVGKRFLLIAGRFTHKKVVEIIGEKFPEVRENLPTGEALEKGGDGSVIGDYSFDNSQARDVLGIQFKELKESVVDTVKSLKGLEKN